MTTRKNYTHLSYPRFTAEVTPTSIFYPLYIYFLMLILYLVLALLIFPTGIHVDWSQQLIFFWLASACAVPSSFGALVLRCSVDTRQSARRLVTVRWGHIDLS